MRAPLSIGTRGDLQPLDALAFQLKRPGAACAISDSSP
jgi:hypothetical protein